MFISTDVTASIADMQHEEQHYDHQYRQQQQQQRRESLNVKQDSSANNSDIRLIISSRRSGLIATTAKLMTKVFAKFLKMIYR